jgi:hypothetical protein
LNPALTKLAGVPEILAVVVAGGLLPAPESEVGTVTPEDVKVAPFETADGTIVGTTVNEFRPQAD